MAVTLSTAAKNASVDAVVDLLDAGSANSAGQLVFRTSGDVEVATLALSNPAFGNAASGTATAASISDDSSATGGTVSKATLEDRDETEVLECSVTASGGGGDIILSSLAVGASDTVSCSSLTISQP